MNRLVLACVLAFWFGLVSAQELQVFVPKAGSSLTGVTVTFEHYLIERRTESVAGKRLASEFAKKLESDFRKINGNSVVVPSAHCEVILRDWNRGEPNFKISCLATGQYVPYEQLSETLDEVLTELRNWTIEFKKRSENRRPRLRLVPPSLPTRSEMVRMT